MHSSLATGDTTGSYSQAAPLGIITPGFASRQGLLQSREHGDAG